MEDVPSGGRRKYALVQKLPNGEWWTSLNLDVPDADSKTLIDLNTAHAELVSVLPSSSVQAKPPPTLGSLQLTGKAQTNMKPIGPRRISCGSFLDYGDYTSFAPTFDSDSADLGVNALTNAVWRRHEKEKAREKARILADRYRKKLAASASAMESMDVDPVSDIDSADPATSEDQEGEKRRELLVSVFGEEVEDMERLLDSLDCEMNIEQLLKNNAKALLRLEDLQRRRLGSEKGGSSIVEVGSDEWTVGES